MQDYFSIHINENNAKIPLQNAKNVKLGDKKRRVLQPLLVKMCHWNTMDFDNQFLTNYEEIFPTHCSLCIFL